MLATLGTMVRAPRPFLFGGKGETPLLEPLHALHLRNHTLDALFYDVGEISHDTVDQASALPFSEGGILVVHPGKRDRLEFFAGPAQFLRAGTSRPRTIAVAGVGSSAVGTAAFAKNVANAVGAPVAGVVSGYGMNDLLSEAMGGWFLFRPLNKQRHRMDGENEPPAALAAWDDALSPDTTTLTALFSANEPLFDVVVGHSKGNLSIAEALYRTQSKKPAAAKALLRHAHIITLSAAIYMPNAAKRVTDIIGAIDWFGRLNSHPDVEPDIVMAGAWHHTNTHLPAHLNVTEAVSRALREN